MTPSAISAVGRWSPGAGGVFQGLDGAEKGTEAGFVALDIRVWRPLVAQYAVGLFFWLAGLGEGQLSADGEFEFVQEGVIAGRGTHLSSKRYVSECGAGRHADGQPPTPGARGAACVRCRRTHRAGWRWPGRWRTPGPLVPARPVLV